MILFQALFAFASVDAYFNGPKLVDPRPHVLLFLSLVALVLSTLHVKGWIALLLIQFFWFCAYIESEYLAKRAMLELELEAKSKAEAKGEDQGLPDEVTKFLHQAVETFRKNLAGPNNYLNQPWKLVESKNGVDISQSDFPGQKCKFWKVEAEITGDLTVFKREIFDYTVRCSWDVAVASGRVVKQFPLLPTLGVPCIMQFYTAPAGGGAVSSRELCDFGVLIDDEKDFQFVNCSVPPALFKYFPELPSKVTGVRGFAHPGSGCRILPTDKPNKFKYCLVTALDLGGWLPASLINSATTSALGDGTKNMMDHLERVSNK